MVCCMYVMYIVYLNNWTRKRGCVITKTVEILSNAVCICAVRRIQWKNGQTNIHAYMWIYRLSLLILCRSQLFSRLFTNPYINTRRSDTMYFILDLYSFVTATLDIYPVWPQPRIYTVTKTWISFPDWFYFNLFL